MFREEVVLPAPAGDETAVFRHPPPRSSAPAHCLDRVWRDRRPFGLQSWRASPPTTRRSPDFIDRHGSEQVSPLLAGTQIAHATILRPLCCNEVGDFGERLRGGNADARWNTDPALDTLTQLPRKRLHFPLAKLTQVQEALINRVLLNSRRHREKRCRHFCGQASVYVEWKCKENPCLGSVRSERRRARGNVGIPQGFPRGVERVESAFCFPCFPYAVISIVSSGTSVRVKSEKPSHAPFAPGSPQRVTRPDVAN